MFSNERPRPSVSGTSRVRYKLGRYKSLVILIALLSGWITLHITRSVIDYHHNEALKTQERSEISQKSAMEFRVHQEKLAMDYQYGNMEERDVQTDVPDVPDIDTQDEKTTSRQPEVNDLSEKYINNDDEETVMRRLNIDELVLDSKTSRMEKLKGDRMMNQAADSASNNTLTRVAEAFTEMPGNVQDELAEYREEASRTGNNQADDNEKDYTDAK